ncbi:MAG: hypothetical protein WC527_08525 [Candidatus Margulisiibacteriota bacterium]
MNVTTTAAVPKLGLLTVPLHFKTAMRKLEGIRGAAQFCSENRFSCMQVAMFPTKGPAARDFSAETLNAKWVLRNQTAAREGVREITEKTGVSIDSVSYCDNILGNPRFRAHLEDVIRAGGVIGAKSVVTFIGNANPLAKKAKVAMQGAAGQQFFIDKVGEIFGPLSRLASDNGMQLQIENCPMGFAMNPNGLTGVTNLFSSPALFKMVLEAVPELNIHFDPSHIRNYRGAASQIQTATSLIASMIERFGKNFGISNHLKDGEDNRQGILEHQSLGDPFDPNTHTQGLWIARAPGRGAIDWLSFEATMRANAPHCLTRIVELEDLSADTLEKNMALFRATADYYRDVVFVKVYGSTGE